MKKKAIYVGIANLKGGVGKSVITVIIASVLHYLMQKKVAIIDADHPQYSISAMRERDVKMVESNNYYKDLFYRQYNKLAKKAYPVEVADPKNVIEVAEKLTLKYTDLDVVFFDLSGSTNSQGILETILNLDWVFCPLITDRIVLQSSLSFISTINQWLSINKDAYPLHEPLVFWNKIDKRENKGMYNIANMMLEDLKIRKMKSEIIDTSKFKKELSASKEVFRSTLFPPNMALLRGTGMEEWAYEFCRIIKI